MLCYVIHWTCGYVAYQHCFFFQCGDVRRFDVYYWPSRGLIVSLLPCSVTATNLHCSNPILHCRHKFRIVVTYLCVVQRWCVDHIWPQACCWLFVLRWLYFVVKQGLRHVSCCHAMCLICCEFACQDYDIVMQGVFANLKCIVHQAVGLLWAYGNVAWQRQLRIVVTTSALSSPYCVCMWFWVLQLLYFVVKQGCNVLRVVLRDTRNIWRVRISTLIFCNAGVMRKFDVNRVSNRRLMASVRRGCLLLGQGCCALNKKQCKQPLVTIYNACSIHCSRTQLVRVHVSEPRLLNT